MGAGFGKFVCIFSFFLNPVCHIKVNIQKSHHKTSFPSILKFSCTFALKYWLMIKRLKEKWQVSFGRLILILMTFAIGGSLTGIIGRKIMDFTGIDVWWLYYPLYIILMTLIWPAMVILISIPFGQFPFFTQYIKKMFSRFSPNRISAKSGLTAAANAGYPKKIAIFASGTGSNSQKIIDHFKHSGEVEIACILYNKPTAGVKRIAEEENIPAIFLEKKAFFESDQYLTLLKELEIDLVVLAGFLWKVPDSFIHAFPGAIINIHPALLPDYGGKGMYGSIVHEAVIRNQEAFSGITIHFVDQHYDNGDIIFQAKCPVLKDDTPETLARRIHLLEHANYPVVIETLLKQSRL